MHPSIRVLCAMVALAPACAARDLLAGDAGATLDVGGRGDETGAPVGTCDAAFAAIAHWDGRRDTGIACHDFDRCWRCPVLVSCVDGMIRVEASSILCDAGAPADAATSDAAARFASWSDCGWPDGANTCLCDGVAACDPVAGGMWAPLGSSAMRTCARRGSTCDIAYFTETEGGAAGYRCSIAIGACGFDLARDCEQVLSCNLLMGDCPVEIVPTNVIPCELAFP